MPAATYKTDNDKSPPKGEPSWNYDSFKVSYAVLTDQVHTPNLGTIKPTLVLGDTQSDPNKVIHSMEKWNDVFIIKIGKHEIVVPFEHVRYCVPIR